MKVIDNIDDILVEWSYKLKSGTPDIKNKKHVRILECILFDMGFKAGEIIPGLESLSEITEANYVDNSQNRKLNRVGKEWGTGGKQEPKKKEEPEKDTIAKDTKRDDKVVNSFSDEYAKIIKGELKAKGTGGSMVGEMYGGISLKNALENPNMTEDEFVELKFDEVKNSPISKGIKVKDIKEWLRIAHRTGKSELKALKDVDQGYNYKEDQPIPYPIPLMDPVAGGGSTRKKVESIFSDGLKNAKTPEDKAHYEKQLKLIKQKEDTDTAILYINNEGNITMKHTSNKKDWADPTANTSVRARSKLMVKSTERLAKENGIPDKQSKQISNNLTKTSEEAANEISNAATIASKNVSDNIDDSQKFATTKKAGKLFSNFGAGQTGRKNYLNDMKFEMSADKGLGKKINKKLEELNIDPKKASDDQIAGAVLDIAKTDSAVSVRKFVNKLSDNIANVNEVYESEKRQNPDASDSELKDLVVKRLNDYKINKDDPGAPFDRDMVDSLMSDDLSFLKDTAKNERDIMVTAHNKIVTDIHKADEQFKKDNPDLADKFPGNGPHAKAYLDTFMNQMHFDKHISGDNDGISSMNISGYNVSPKMIRDSIKELTGFKGDIETSKGKRALMRHLRENLKLDPESKSISIRVGDKDIELGQDLYRTKGTGVNSVMGFFGKDMQKLLKNKAIGK
jgi:hypothetical protein